MKGIWTDIAEKLKIDGELIKQRSYTVLGESMVVVEGQKKVLSVNAEEISFEYGKKTLAVRGQGLKLKTISKGFAVVEGKIDSVERL